MQKADEAARLYAHEQAIENDGVSRLAGIALSASVASGFWTWVIWITGTSAGHQPETATLELIAVAIASIVAIALTALPAAD
jgi:hypothetical protein